MPTAPKMSAWPAGGAAGVGVGVGASVGVGVGASVGVGDGGRVAGETWAVGVDDDVGAVGVASDVDGVDEQATTVSNEVTAIRFRTEVFNVPILGATTAQAST